MFLILIRYCPVSFKALGTYTDFVVSKRLVTRLQRVRNSTARLVTSTRTGTHITPVCDLLASAIGHIRVAVEDSAPCVANPSCHRPSLSWSPNHCQLCHKHSLLRMTTKLSGKIAATLWNNQPIKALETYSFR